MSKKNGFVLVDISDGRIMNIGLDTATVEGSEVPGIEVIENGASRKFILPMDKAIGNHTIAMLDDIPAPGGGGKLYRHTFFATYNGNTLTLEDGDIISFIVTAYSSTSSPFTVENAGTYIKTLMGYVVMKNGDNYVLRGAFIQSFDGIYKVMQISVIQGIKERLNISGSLFDSFLFNDDVREV